MHVFLSYNNRDRRVAERVCDALRQRRPGLDIYFAPERNQVGAYWMTQLGQELADTDAVVLLLGDKVGVWQEIEYYDALKRNRKAGKPVIAPIALAERLPGLPFLDHFHRLIFERHSFEELIDHILTAIDGAKDTDGQPDEPLWRQVNPYAGLPAMRTEDAAFFVGREDLSGSIIDALRQKPDRIHTLIGSSGVGKSSLAFAGVLASLRSRIWPGDVNRDWPTDLETSPGWLPIVVTPGVKPCKELARSIVKTWLDQPSDIEREASAWAKLFAEGSDLITLARAAREEIAKRTGAEPPARAILYVDQGEELYTRADPSDAATFSRLIAGGVTHPDIMVMASLRADYYGQWQADEPIFQNGDRIDVPPLTKEQIERVVREPAERLGVKFDNPEIVSVIAEATWKEPGGLPMLSYLMQDAWEEMRRDDTSDGTLHFPFRIVDVSRPLVDRAERFLELHPDETDTLRRLLTLRLAHVPREGLPVRRRAQRSDCTDAEWALVDALAGGDWRLLTTSDADEEAVAEVAHEALLRHWPRLSQWLDAEREFLIWKGQLETARLAWEEAADDQKDQALLMGLSLTTAREWRAGRGAELSDANRGFIDRSIDQADQATQRRTRQRLWIKRSAVAAIVLLVAFSAAAAWQAMLAEQQRDQAEAALFQAQVEQARSRAILAEMLVKDGDIGEAIDVALRAMPQSNPAGWPDVNEIMEVPRVLAAALLDRRETMVLRGHDDFVTSASFSPDGSRILTASWDGTARLWNTADGAEIAVLEGHNRPVSSARFSPDGSRIVTAGDDGTVRVWTADGNEDLALLTIPDDNGLMAVEPGGSSVATASPDGSVRLWDMATGEENAPLAGHDSTVTFAVFSPDGTRIITTSKDATARLWDTETSEEVAVLDGQGGSVSAAAFSPDGDRVLTVSSDNTARLWNTDNGSMIDVLSGHEDEISSAHFSPEGNLIATTSTDDTARIWNAFTGQLVVVLRGHDDSVSNAAFSADETRLVTSSRDDTARIWNTGTGVEVAVLSGHDDIVAAAMFSPDGRQVVTAAFDNTARLWDAGDGAEVTLIAGSSTVSLSPDGERIATAAFDNTARISSIADGIVLTDLNGHEGAVTAATFSPDGTQVVTSSQDDSARVWDTETGEVITALENHVDDISAAAFSPDGTRLATASWDTTARLWDLPSGDEIAVLGGHDEMVSHVVYSPDGSMIATVARDDTARLWDAQTGSELAVLDGHDGRITAIAFSPDGTQVLTASADTTARLWDADGGAEMMVLNGHDGTVSAAAFSPDGSSIVTASINGDVLIWDSASGTVTRNLSGHDWAVHSVAFSPRGDRILTASSDETVRLWDAATGTTIAVLNGHRAPVMTAEFSRDGDWIVTSSRDRTARIWRHFQTMDALWQHAAMVVDLLQPLSPAEECEYNLRVEGCDDYE